MGSVLFCFAGRRSNMELQLRWVQRVLDLNSDTVYHVWSLARDPEDAAWLRTISGERISVHTGYQDLPPGAGINQVWRHYATNSRYADATLVKVDDDVVFMDAYRYAELVTAAESNPGLIVSADVINNGAGDQPRHGCNPHTVHMENGHAVLAHRWMSNNWKRACDAPGWLQRDPGWLSINMVAMRQPVAHRVHARIGKPSPPMIEGMRFRSNKIGDEGAVNLLPHAIQRGVIAAHLGFGPQHLTERQEQQWRALYAEILDLAL